MTFRSHLKKKCDMIVISVWDHDEALWIKKTPQEVRIVSVGKGSGGG